MAWLVLRLQYFLVKKGFEILGVDNNARKFFFGPDGDISWIKKSLKKKLKITITIILI